MAIALFATTMVYAALYTWDNKYTAALSGGYGYNQLQEDPDQVGFLIDGWEYYPGQLLEPAAFDNDSRPKTYTYIGQYANFSAHLGSAYGTATYRLLLIGGNQTDLVLYLPELLCAGKIYINGQLVGEQGSLDPYEPHVMDGIYPFVQDGQTEIIIQCANYSHYYSGMYYPPAVGSSGTIFRMITLRLIVYGVLCFSTLAVALAYLSQWLLGRDRMARWMGLLSLAFSIRVLYPFFRALGIPLVQPLYLLEDLCGNLVLLCAVLLAGELAGVTTQRYHRGVAIPAAVGLSAVSLIFPGVILPYAPVFINLYGFVLYFWKLLAGLYLLFLAGHTLQNEQPLGQYLLCASGIYGWSIGASVVFANRLEPVYGAWLEEYGGFALIAGFTGLMVWRSVLLTRENYRLNQNLQQEVERKTEGMNALLKERRQLLAGLLHDIKNSLAALQNYVELIRYSKIALDQETTGYLAALTERAETLADRLEVLRDFSRGERNEFPMETLCLNTVLQEFYQANLPDMELGGQQFILQLPQKRLLIRGNRERLQAVLENLCYNALSFTPNDGTITLGLIRKNRDALLTVRVTGPGIPKEDLPRVFEQGFTRRPDGSGEGLGLFLVRSIVLEHGGAVQVQSEVGKGSVFIVRLPLWED